MLGCESLHTLCPVGGVIPRVVGCGSCTHCRVIPWVHVRESAGVWVPAHTVPSGRCYTTSGGVWVLHTLPGYTMGACEGECGRSVGS